MPRAKQRGAIKQEDGLDNTVTSPGKAGRSTVAKKEEEEYTVKTAEQVSPVKPEMADLTPKPSPQLRKKLQQLEMFRKSPYPDMARPTPEDCQSVCDALATVHRMPSRPVKLESKDTVGASCGQVPDILDALIRTILSQNTTSKNSRAAKASLDAAFPTYDDVRVASHEAVAEALAPGGLSNVKAKVIKKILDSVWERTGGKSLSLDELHNATDEEALKTLVSFDGVGPKTASCVLLFCMGRSSFAVDTHVFRITKALKWVPAKATRETAFQHLDCRIPDHLKYPLHSMIVGHGRACKDCAANGVLTNEPVECPLKPFLHGKRPREIEDEEADSPSKRGKKGSKKAKKAESDDDEDDMHGIKV